MALLMGCNNDCCCTLLTLLHTDVSEVLLPNHANPMPSKPKHPLQLTRVLQCRLDTLSCWLLLLLQDQAAAAAAPGCHASLLLLVSNIY
jgi:hypothetical protein